MDGESGTKDEKGRKGGKDLGGGGKKADKGRKGDKDGRRVRQLGRVKKL